MDIRALFEGFTKKRILVIGDVMIDAYLRGSVDRVSPEAPVPIVNLKKSEDRLGGAANVALNLRALGADAVLCSVIGNDKAGSTFEYLLDQLGMSRDGMIKDQNRQTTVKTRVIGNNQHLLRVDEEDTSDINQEQEAALISRISEIVADGIDAIIFEDYNKGVFTPRVIQEIVVDARQHDVPTTVDPKKTNFFAYKNVTLFKPNLKELKDGLDVQFDFNEDKNAFESAVKALEDRLSNKITLITLSENGVFVKEDNEQTYIPAHIRRISDVSGAGDTVIAVATLCLTMNLAPAMIADIANLAGGLVCERSGVVPIDKEQLSEEVKKTVLA